MPPTKDTYRRVATHVVVWLVCVGSKCPAQDGLAAIPLSTYQASGDAVEVSKPGAARSTTHFLSEISMPFPRSKGAWWKPRVSAKQRSTQRSLNISLNSLLIGALAHSAQVQLMSDAPLISETEITTADSAFDWISFLDSRWDDINVPVGSTLTTGGPDRLLDHNASVEVGIRRRNTRGGEVEIGQRFGHQNNNSIFFVPNDQGTTRLTLSYTQPLLRGGGRVYNTSLTVLAKLDSVTAQHEFERQLQEHLYQVTSSYWTLYLERSKLLLHQRLLERGTEILTELESREAVDALQSQIVRARSAVASRRADLVRAEYAIRTAEARIRSLVNDPELGETMNTELRPMDPLDESPFTVDLHSSLEVALRERPEIAQAVQQVKAACVRMHMGKKETLPMLNVVLETYLSGLAGESRVGTAFTEQFTEGDPSYGVGLQYEYPIWNRSAKSKLQRRRLEVRRMNHQFRNTVETLKLEVEVAVHDVNSAHQSLIAKYSALDAAAEEVSYLRDRWQLLPVDNGSASLLLEDLLDAQERLTDTETGVLESGLSFALAKISYKRALGTLLKHHQVDVDRSCECNLPRQTAFQHDVANQYQMSTPVITRSPLSPRSVPARAMQADPHMLSSFPVENESTPPSVSNPQQIGVSLPLSSVPWEPAN